MHDGRVRGPADVREFVTGRVETAGHVAATFAAAACHAAYAGDGARIEALEDGLDARMPSPASRATSRQLGRQLVRVASGLCDDTRFRLLRRQPHQPLALGVACAVFDLTPRDAALAILHETAAGVVAAAVRLLSLDPLVTHRVLADCRGRLDELADQAQAECSGDIDGLPAGAAPLLDLYAERHSHRRGRLFSS